MILSGIMVATVLCPICLDRALQKHAIALFTDGGTRMEWSTRLEELLHIPVSASDCLPPYICRGCRGKVESIEKKLGSLTEKARASYEKLSRTKPTSSAIGVSPANAKA